MTGAAEVRPGSAADLEALVTALGQRDWFSRHLAAQRGGGGMLLVAWVDGRPVGDGFLDWRPAEEAKLRRWLPDVPQLGHLEVLGPLQRRGIGTALIRAAEAAAHRRGHDRLVLAVGVDNPDARRLYERLGYVDWGHGAIVGTWVERDHDGPPVTVSEVCLVLVRTIG